MLLVGDDDDDDDDDDDAILGSYYMIQLTIQNLDSPPHQDCQGADPHPALLVTVQWPASASVGSGLPLRCGSCGRMSLHL